MRVYFFIKYIIRHNISDALWQFFASKIRSFGDKKYKEKRKCFGSLNPDVTFYVIRHRPPGWGFFSNLIFVCQGLLHAKEQGYIPVVDMENYWNKELNSAKRINGTYNAWCYFFKQPSPYSLDEVYKSKNVILSDGAAPISWEHWLNARKKDLLKSELLEQLNSIISESIVLNSETENYVKRIKHELNWSFSETLGVFIRGTAYHNRHVEGNFNMPTLDSFLSEISKFLNQTSIRNIYIATEDYRVYLYLSDKLSKYNIIPSLRYRFNLSVDEWLRSQKISFEGGIIMGYEKTLTYLTEMILLSECKNFIGTYSNASIFVLGNTDLTQGDRRIMFKDNVVYLNAK